MTSKTRLSFVIIDQKVVFSSDEVAAFLKNWAQLAHLVEEKMQLKENEYLNWRLSIHVISANSSCLSADVGYHQGTEITRVTHGIRISEWEVSPGNINSYADQVVAALRGQRQFQTSGAGTRR